MKKFFGVVLAFFLLAVSTASAVDAKIGYVDLQRALNTSEAGKAAKEKIGKTVQQYEGAVNARQEELKKLKDELDRQALGLSDEARAAREREYQQKLRDFQRFTKDIQEELQQKDADYTRQILEGLFRVVREIGEKEGYVLILEQGEGSIIYADPKSDLTEEVIKVYDARQKSGGK
jgi:outer membrane protein